MDVLFQAIWDRLDGDTELGNLTGKISFRRSFEYPNGVKSIDSPIVVFHSAGGPEAEDLHGAAIDAQIEVNVWGYGGAMAKTCYKAAQRIDELFLEKFDLSDGGKTRRFRSITGWEDPDSGGDPKIVRLLNTYQARYWSDQRISALNS